MDASAVKTKQTLSDRVFDIINITIAVISLIIVAYPLYFIVIASVSDPVLVNTGSVWFVPKSLNFEGYKRILMTKDLWMGYKNTIMYTVVGTLVNLVLTLTGAYALSRKDLVGRKFFTRMILFTMLFSGGMIPTFLLIRGMGLYNNFWAMILPKAIMVWNFIIAKTYFESNIPDELYEAASLDGCGDWLFFRSIVLPLSKAIVMVLIIYYAVNHWNTFFDAMIYLKDRNLFSLQLILREILLQSQFADEMSIADKNAQNAILLAEYMKYGVIIVASAPVMMLYPLVQKHFVKGVMIGAIKG